jgi:uncharacterized SAM-binding protein YcdF (DUF218 family)
MRHMRGGLSFLSRCAALGAGIFVLANGVGEALRPGFSALGEWFSIAGGPSAGAAAFSVLLGAVLVGLGLGLDFGRFRWSAAAVIVTAALIAFWDAARFYSTLRAGNIATPVFVPASLPIAIALLGLALVLIRARATAWQGRHLWLAPLTVAAMLGALPLVRVFTFGLTRYARHADVAVVLGARAYADGTPSLALADRVDEAVRAYHRGLVRRLIMSGGIDPSSRVSEARVMRDRAVRAGVPPGAIGLDEQGASTALTARNVARLVPAGASVLLVSHYYHLPRTALLFRRQGLRPFTLPARMTRRLLHEPWFVAREVPAFYVDWLTG